MNQTHSTLLATRPPNIIAFSGTVNSASTYLPGPGGQAGDGYPLPRRAILTQLHLWDSTSHYFDSDEIALDSGDRLALYCQSTGSDFAVKVRVNGNSTNLQVTGIPYNRTLYATVELLLIRE